MSGKDCRTVRKFSRRTFGPYDGDRPRPPIAICCRHRFGRAFGSTPISFCHCARRCGSRANLLIADDVGLGKTVEAGLVARELLLRRRIDFIVITAPPAMRPQRKDELEAKFGLSFEIIDRERVGEMCRLRGFFVSPSTTGSRFIISHHLLTDEVYAARLRDALGEFRARALLILDEAATRRPRQEPSTRSQASLQKPSVNWSSALSIVCS
jgi:hypothetical protein